MRNSKLWAIAIKAVAFVLLFALLVTGLNAWLAPTNTIRNKLKVYQRAESPDVLMMGNSTVMRLVPKYLDEITGMDVHQMGSPMQSLTASYYLLQEAIDQGKKPDTLMLYMHIRRFEREGSDYDFAFVQALPWGRSKIGMLKDAFTLDDLPEAIFPCVYGREELFTKVKDLLLPAAEADEMKEIKARLKEDYATIKKYFGKGVNSITNDAQNPRSVEIGATDTFNLDAVNQASLKVFYDIVELCEENDIDLVLFTLPILPGNLIATGGDGYGAFHDYVQELADQMDIPYWDFSYLKESVLKVDSSMFSDSRHGNATFALKVGEVIGTMLREYKEGSLKQENYLYDDYETYLQTYKGVNALYPNGAVYSSGNTKNYINIRAALGADTVMETRVSVAPLKSDDFEVFQDWSTKKRVVFGDKLKPGKYRIKFEARTQGSEEVEQTLIKTYTFK